MKMVIVMRKDLNMRKGKMCAQAGHAVQLCLMAGNEWTPEGQRQSDKIKEWCKNHRITKICVGVENEMDLMAVRGLALDKGLHVSLVLDAGKTEFKEPTYTCLAIGPDDADLIDSVTGGLKLL